jgi:ring-1,2-phenylacetyl-CoA epoxidase subunit PaaB
VHVSLLTEGDDDAYNHINESSGNTAKKKYEIFHLYKRGKQHIDVGTVEAADPGEAMWVAKQQLKVDKQVFNIWAICNDDIRFTNQEDLDFWNTLSEKKFRDAAAYKGGDKLKFFLEKSKQ